MQDINLNNILDRGVIVGQIVSIIKNFETNKHDITQKRGIYIYGNPGIGKTYFIKDILKQLNYDIVLYNAGDVRNKSVIDMITMHNIATVNIMSSFNGVNKNIGIIMDEIDGMNNGDKGGINSLIKLIRPKKTKKQKLEETTNNPIICIGNYHMDKKIKELMKVCHVIEFKTPTPIQIKHIILSKLPYINTHLLNNIIAYINGDLRKLTIIIDIFKLNKLPLTDSIFTAIFNKQQYNDDTKMITKKLLSYNYNLPDHLLLMNETDRTIVGLLWHENIVDLLTKINKNEAIPFYIKVLKNICFADFIDRITFQKQIWQLNELSSLIKTFHTNKMFHTTISRPIKITTTELRFTKVLTKYSTEYNNYLFIQLLCQQLNMDKKDLLLFFLDLRQRISDEKIYLLLENYEITKLDINRIYRYIDKFISSDIPEDFDIIESDTS